MKRCFKCLKKKSIDEFYKHSQMADGHLGKCKECAKKDAHEIRLGRIDYYREFDLMRANLPHRKELHRLTANNHKSSHPERYHARNAVGHAIRDGKLNKPSCCTQCGRSDKVIHAHHHDYSKPLEVEWLCIACHFALHEHLNQKQIKACPF